MVAWGEKVSDIADYTLLTRAGCHLCEEFLETLREHGPEIAALVTIADVDSRSDWQQRFGLRVPVLIDRNGAVLAEGMLDAERIKQFDSD